jgi:putative acetyltransferase
MLVLKEDLLAPAAQELIACLNDELSERYPDPAARHFRLDADEVLTGRGAFLIAYVDARPAGCGALRTIEEGVGEIKRMYVRPSERGRGIGRALLEALEAEARRMGMRRLILETGIRQHEALALYRNCGFLPVPPFGEYMGSPLSVCMARDL